MKSTNKEELSDNTFNHKRSTKGIVDNDLSLSDKDVVTQKKGEATIIKYTNDSSSESSRACEVAEIVQACEPQVQS